MKISFTQKRKNISIAYHQEKIFKIFTRQGKVHQTSQ